MTSNYQDSRYPLEDEDTVVLVGFGSCFHRPGGTKDEFTTRCGISEFQSHLHTTSRKLVEKPVFGQVNFEECGRCYPRRHMGSPQIIRPR